jgi:hypothetical protein
MSEADIERVASIPRLCEIAVDHGQSDPVRGAQVLEHRKQANLGNELVAVEKENAKGSQD